MKRLVCKDYNVIKKILFTIIVLFVIDKIYAQGCFIGNVPNNYNFAKELFKDAPTPESKALGTYGNIPVSYFEGKADINIPLYELKCRDISVPICLRYDASGVKPNELPTWVGQNWCLNAGGVITREVRGYYDEWKYPKAMDARFIEPYKNYFQDHTELNAAFVDSLNNYSSLTEYIYKWDCACDVYNFNFLGKSGKFWLDTDGEWKVQSDFNFEIIFDYNDSKNYTEPLFARYPFSVEKPAKTIAGFVIRDDNGISYVFGYEKNAIEFNTNFWEMQDTEEVEAWHATSWHLSKIIDKYGNILFSFDYIRGCYIAQVFNNFYWIDTHAENHIDDFLWFGDLTPNSDMHLQNSDFPYTISIVSPVYLNKIIGMNGISTTFISNNVSDEMSTEKIYHRLYDKAVGDGTLYDKLRDYSGRSFHNTIAGAYFYLNGEDSKDFPLSLYRYNSNCDKDGNTLSRTRLRVLNNILFEDSNNPQSITDCGGWKFKYSYVNHRLKLDSILFFNNNCIKNIAKDLNGVYKFSYEDFEQLPDDYLTRATDHWGYYNGKEYEFLGKNFDKNSFVESRIPCYSYTKKGILKKIEYPTGGVSVFEYEPNYFGAYQNKERTSMIDSVGIGGGLRIKSITEYEDNRQDKVLKKREYSYNKPNTALPSGELPAKPMYYWKKMLFRCLDSDAHRTYDVFQTSPVVPLVNSFGTGLGYTYVTETIKDYTIAENISKTVYQYSNLSDSSVRDRKYVYTFANPNNTTIYDMFSELGFKRGRLVCSTIYNGQGQKIKTTRNIYRGDDFKKNYSYTTNLFTFGDVNSASYISYMGSIYKMYYSLYDIIEEHDTIFHENSCQTTITKYHNSDQKVQLTYPYLHQTDVRLTDSITYKQNKFYKKIVNDYVSQSVGAKDTLYGRMFYIKPFSVSEFRNNIWQNTVTTYYRGEEINGQTYMLPSVILKTQDSVVDTMMLFKSYTATGQIKHYKSKGEPDIYQLWCNNENNLLMKSTEPITYEYGDVFNVTNKGAINYMRLYNSRNKGMTIGFFYAPFMRIGATVFPNANVNYYKYDGLSSLKEILDVNEKKTNTFDYKFRP